MLGCSPTKLYEYLSVGLEVISPDLFFEPDVFEIIHIYESLEDILEIFESGKNRNNKSQTQEFLKKNVTSFRTKQILDIVNKA